MSWPRCLTISRRLLPVPVLVVEVEFAPEEFVVLLVVFDDSQAVSVATNSSVPMSKEPHLCIVLWFYVGCLWAGQVDFQAVEVITSP